MRRFNRIVAGAALVFLVGTTVLANIPETNLFRVQERSNMVKAGAGWIYMAVIRDNVVPDTVRISDTSAAMDMVGAVRGSISYKLGIYDGSGNYMAFDSCKAKLLYQWSNDGEHWISRDSSAALTDTLFHEDTLILGPFNFMRIVGRPAQPSGYAFDTTGTLGADPTFLIGWFRVQPIYVGTKKK